MTQRREEEPFGNGTGLWKGCPYWLKMCLIFGPLGLVFGAVMWHGWLFVADERTDRREWNKTQRETLVTMAASVEKQTNILAKFETALTADRKETLAFQVSVSAKHEEFLKAQEHTQQFLELQSKIMEGVAAERRQQTDILKQTLEAIKELGKNEVRPPANNGGGGLKG